MSQISKGDTFSNGQQVDALRLNSLVDSATLLVGAITNQPNITPNTLVATDSTIVNDGGVLKEATIGDFLNSNLPITTSSITGGAGVDIVLTPASGREVDVAGNFQVIGNSITTGTASVGGTLGVTGNLTANANLTVNGTTTLVGIATAPTAAPNTNTTQLATTAFVLANQPPQLIKAWADVRFFTPVLSGTYSRTGTLVTVTITSHGITSGQSVLLDFTSGLAVDGLYVATVISANQFTINTVASGTTSGNVNFQLVARSSLNISNIQILSAVGPYIELMVSFSTPLVDANYAVFSQVEGGYSISSPMGLKTLLNPANYTKTASQFRIGYTSWNWTAGDEYNPFGVFQSYVVPSDFSIAVVR